MIKYALSGCSIIDRLQNVKLTTNFPNGLTHNERTILER